MGERKKKFFFLKAELPYGEELLEPSGVLPRYDIIIHRLSLIIHISEINQQPCFL